MDNRKWMQDLFDLMANKQITLTVTGEMGDVWATLRIHDILDKKGKEIADVCGAADFESAMSELMEKYVEYKQTA